MQLQVKSLLLLLSLQGLIVRSAEIGTHPELPIAASSQLRELHFRDLASPYLAIDVVKSMSSIANIDSQQGRGPVFQPTCARVVSNDEYFILPVLWNETCFQEKLAIQFPGQAM